MTKEKERIVSGEAKLIPLTQGKFAVVDAADYGWLMQWKWCAIHKTTKSGMGVWYAERRVPGVRKQRNVYMHREIATVAGRFEVDHRDHDGLNNRRGNLRPATRSQNSRNHRKQPGCSSRFKGVYWCKDRSKWQAYINVNGKMLFLGRFTSEVEAGAAYAAAARKCFGEFAHAPGFI